MLIGEYFNKIGEKKRVALPKKFREILGSEIIVARGYENCVMVVNEKQWKRLLDIFQDKPFTTNSVRDTRRFLIGGASEVSLDKQGRFVLPLNLRGFAGIEKEVVFVGLVDWVEIWDREQWIERMKMVKLNAAKIADKLQKDEQEK